MQLGELELLLLSRVRDLGPITPSRLFEDIQGDWNSSFSTLATTLRRLEEKGLIQSTPLKGRSVEYSVDTSKKVYNHMASLLAKQLVAAFGNQQCPEWCNSKLLCSMLHLTLGKSVYHLTVEEIDELMMRLEEMKNLQLQEGYEPPPSPIGCGRSD